MLVTKQLIESLETGNGGYSKKALNVIGVRWPPKKGWKKKAIGREVDEVKYQRFLEAKK